MRYNHLPQLDECGRRASFWMTFVAIAATKAASATLDSCICIKKHLIIEFFRKNVPMHTILTFNKYFSFLFPEELSGKGHT